MKQRCSWCSLGLAALILHKTVLLLLLIMLLPLLMLRWRPIEMGIKSKLWRRLGPRVTSLSCEPHEECGLVGLRRRSQKRGWVDMHVANLHYLCGVCVTTALDFDTVVYKLSSIIYGYSFIARGHPLLGPVMVSVCLDPSWFFAPASWPNVLDAPACFKP